MIGCDESAIPRAATAEHSETEHAQYLAARFHFAQIEFAKARLNRAINQRENALLLRVVIERAKSADLVQSPQTVERVEILRVTGG